LLDSSLLPSVMAFPIFGGASVIVCQGDLADVGLTGSFWTGD
jgi:hypothetical protein